MVVVTMSVSSRTSKADLQTRGGIKRYRKIGNKIQTLLCAAAVGSMYYGGKFGNVLKSGTVVPKISALIYLLKKL
jgi:hypothetical protein